ncbi:MAG: FHA domain-containing protein [Myxococcales bacterium]|nr:FHA domain-containing protein [Myxococcales bacterium]
MPAKLLYRDANGADASVDIPEATPIFLGRAADCAVRTDDAMVSRKNCKLSFLGGKFFVEDLGSSNGTFINERRIQKQQLAHGDIVRCGTLQVRFVEVAGSSRPKTAAVEAVQVEPQSFGGGGVDESVVVEKDAQISAISEERDQTVKAWKEATAELETLRARAEGSDNELKMLRAQSVGSREDLARVKKEHSQDKEELHEVSRNAEELRADLRKLKEEYGSHKTRVDELTEELAARDRQLERALEDVQRTKQSTEELRNKLLELQKTKDEGWNELNKQLAQIDQLREVITEQERILEERRVGLIALEAATKDVRAEKEKMMRELVDTKNQRDDLRERLNRAESKVEGLEEEHRRLARMMASQAGGSGSAGEDFAKMAAEVRELKIENRKLENQKTRFESEAERAATERSKALEDLAHLEVERTQLSEERKSMEASRDRAEEKLARIESMKQRLEEEKAASGAARDAALASSHDVRHLHDRALRRIAELEKAVSVGAPLPESSESIRKAEAARDQAFVDKTKAESKIHELEEKLQKVNAELASNRAGVSSHQGDRTPPDGTALPEAAGAEAAALKARAKEVYEGINEALSELRTTILTAKGLFGEIAPTVSDEDARKALQEAISESMARTEDAKGSLRSLRDLAQS